MLQTVLGRITAKDAGRILEHEHVLVGFVEDGKLAPNMYDREEVVTSVLPYLLKLKESGCSTMVDCAPEYLGRDPYILRQLSELSGVHLITNTGFYKKPYLPAFVNEITEQDLADIWIREARDGIGESKVFPGFIKIALNDGTVIDDIQAKILRAAMRTSLETGLPIQCHTIGNDIALHAYDIMKKAQFDQERFIWVHAQTFKVSDVYKRLAEAGGWISIDSILPGTYEEHVDLLGQLLGCGVGDRVLLSQDTGWYNVGQHKGGNLRPYHHLFTDFLPAAAAGGLEPLWLEQCVTSHAFQAMSMRS
ncbi:phosphotriesterase [Paenibacillus sp. CF384]|uniref:phosphotriesterase family protein n=1 Tax=Paenibacillus sp. CF384 TaxID=1884382 RepID=UPI000897CD98|nr:phosphotriesterase [Paenibacillus sp. CF384]SDW21183.1 phosphotriesterase-related protein [Paenibacillus sp. CF384]